MTTQKLLAATAAALQFCALLGFSAQFVAAAIVMAIAIYELSL